MTGACLLVKTAVAMTRCTGWTSSSAVAFNDVGLHACGCGMRATALPESLYAEPIHDYEQEPGGDEKTLSRRLALRRNSSGSTPSTARKTFWMTHTTTST